MAPGHGVRFRPLWDAILIVLLAATGYETALAAGAISPGNDPGGGAPGAVAVLLVGLVALLLGGALCLLARGRIAGTSAGVRRAQVLIAPIGIAFVAARFYSFDPYYLPTLRRMSEGGLIRPAWIFVLGGLAMAATACASIVGVRG